MLERKAVSLITSRFFKCNSVKCFVKNVELEILNIGYLIPSA